MKTCSKCGETKPLGEFYSSSRGNKCKECMKAATRKYRAENPEKVKVQQKLWKKKNRTRHNANSENSRRRNPEKYVPEATSRSIKWRKENPDKVRAANQKRRAVKNGLTATLTKTEEKAIWDEFNGVCFWCEERPATSIDHIVPLQPRQGSPGHHVKGNIVPSCMPCNNKKNNKDPLIFLFEIKNTRPIGDST